jgi:hypothetical protein
LVFHVGFVGLLPLGVVPCVGCKLGPHLKARKHFFKVFSAVRKVLSCGAATPPMKHRLHDFMLTVIRHG